MTDPGEGREARLDRLARQAVARRSPLWFAVFVRIFTSALRRDFHAVRVSKSGALPPASTPRLILYSNHPSWWDATVFAAMPAKLFPGRSVFAPIDEVMIGRYGFMTRIGAFGVAQDSLAGAATFLRTAQVVLEQPDNLLIVTPQGRFVDVRERPVRLAPGLAHLLSRVPDATLVPLALDYPFWDERKPELLMRFGEPVPARSLLALDRRTAGDELACRLEATMDILAEEAMTRNAARFTTLIEGGAGVGGFYDLWRRLRALARGERFSAAHGEPS